MKQFCWGSDTQIIGEGPKIQSAASPMLSGIHATSRKKKRRSRTTVKRKVKKLLSDPDYLKEIQRQMMTPSELEMTP